jgi:hypothetical protein
MSRAQQFADAVDAWHLAEQHAFGPETAERLAGLFSSINCFAMSVEVKVAAYKKSAARIIAKDANNLPTTPHDGCAMLNPR